ncbi:esterase B1-like [Rhagoletis pomonella]|uniref:esterase B1-like n=1 Tax=Rhagoletis pomonella TaxID=28610 RepID=UPI00177F7AFE|nr:esterase B1-like [Rhagoletis pomonella]
MSTQEEYLLTLPLGKILGRVCTSIYDQTYYSFEGIPYAKPPLGKLRFRAPHAVEPWTDVKDCTKCARGPLQKNPDTNKVEGAEDCLYLNVYTKKLTSSKPLPVMVFIYGGSFCMGAANRDLYGPDYFMMEDVVLVTFNYRLDSLGFLSLRDPSLKVPGNAGLKDQVLALKWVKKYIAHFNGDPTNVTLFGESAGAASTHLLMLSEQGRDLFKRTIAMSGTALNFWANMPQLNTAFRLAHFHGYKGDNIDAHVFEYISNLAPEKLVVHSLLSEEDQRNSYMFAFGPIVEPYVEDGCVIPERPFDMQKKAWSNHLSMMLGGSSFEGLLLYKVLKENPIVIQRLFREPELILPEEVRQIRKHKDVKKLGITLLKLHFGDEEPNDYSLFKYLDIFSFKIFWHDFHRTILSRLTFARAPTFLYRFDFDSPDFNFYRAKYCGRDNVRGVAHADELSYLFYSNNSRKLFTNTAEYKTIRRMIGMWTAYARSGDPDCDESDPIIWDAVTKYYNLRAMLIGKELEFKEIPEKDKLLVWAKLYPSPQQLCGADREEDYYWGVPIPSLD